MKFRLDDSKTSAVICDEIGLQKIIKIRNDLPFLKYVICIDRKKSEKSIISFSDLLSNSKNVYKKLWI